MRAKVIKKGKKVKGYKGKKMEKLNGL